MYYAQNCLNMDKIDRLLDAIEHPDRYSEKEMEAMLADPEVMEVFALLDKTKASLTPIAAPDVDAEWEAFQSSRRVPDGGAKRRPAILSLFSRNIAASVAIDITATGWSLRERRPGRCAFTSAGIRRRHSTKSPKASTTSARSTSPSTPRAGPS